MSPKKSIDRGEITEYSDVFALDLNEALLLQLPRAIHKLTACSLTHENLGLLASEHGIYQLFHKGEPVYIGKSQGTLKARLTQHLRRCSGRYGIKLMDMSFRCLYVDKFVDAASPESVLIQIFRKEGSAAWNQSEGFAPKDVGRGRGDGKPGIWYIERPVTYKQDVALDLGSGEVPVIDALEALKKAVDFDLFRFASVRSRKGSPDLKSVADYEGRTVTLSSTPLSLMVHLRTILEILPAGWQATVQPQGVILYKESVNYRFAIDGWRQTSRGIEAVPRGDALPNPYSAIGE